MSLLKFNTFSDDNIGYDFEGDGEDIGAPEMDFLVTLPDGTILPMKVTYEDGWEFHVDLPEGSTLEAIPPDEED